MTCNIVSNNIVFFCKTTLSPILEKLHEAAYDLAQNPYFSNNYLAKQKLSYEPKNDILFNCRSGKFFDVP